ncbi:MAG TPA: Gfo/Idh/MocA family oxidoreductase [Clostridia bacterium]|nr:Gfo/Idh/MocA family oxidoreductase [Clostridia bacterium]
MNIAIIGSGFIAGVHAQVLKELGHTVSAVVNVNVKSAEAFARQYKAESFGDDFALALTENVDCVHVCTPPVLHYKAVKAALNAGKHVICEKPMCLNPDEAKELMLHAKARNLVGAVNFNVRFYDACKKAREFISTPAFGGICLIHGSYLQEFHALPDAYTWRYKPELAGQMRATTEIGSHWIDLARFWTGLEIKEVSANYGRFTPDRYVSDGIMYKDEKENSKKITVDSDDAAVISIRFSNGAIGNLLLSEVSHGRNNRISIEVSGTTQSIWWNSQDPYYLNSSRKSGGVNTQINAFSGGFPNTFKVFFEEVYKDIENGRPSENPAYPTFYDGYVNSAVCAAIYESAEKNSAWVKVKQAWF